MNQDVRVLIHPDHVEVTFQIETNDEGRLIEAIAMDADSDGKLSPEEQSRFFAQLDARLREGLQIRVNDKDITLHASSEVKLSPPSQKTFLFKGDIDPAISSSAGFDIHNDNFLDWPGKAKLDVDADSSASLQFRPISSTHIRGLIDLSPVVVYMRLDDEEVWTDWRKWSWIGRACAPIFAVAAAILLGLTACFIMLAGRSSPTRQVIAGAFLLAALTCGCAAYFTRNVAAPPFGGWVHQFRAFHAKLSSAIAAYHGSDEKTTFAQLAQVEPTAKFTAATRVVAPEDEKSGRFELHRVRPIDTTVVEEPRHPFSPILRVHHRWRAIGVIKHDGHSHERTRDFTCDYTLRATDRGLQLIDCSNWHQLPDEPIE